MRLVDTACQVSFTFQERQIDPDFKLPNPFFFKPFTKQIHLTFDPKWKKKEKIKGLERKSKKKRNNYLSQV